MTGGTDDDFWMRMVQEYAPPTQQLPSASPVTAQSDEPQGIMARLFAGTPESRANNAQFVSALDGLGQSFEGLGGYAQPKTRPYGGAQFRMPDPGVGLRTLIAQILRGAA